MGIVLLCTAHQHLEVHTPYVHDERIDAVPDLGCGMTVAAQLSRKFLCGYCMRCKYADYCQHGMSLNALPRCVSHMQKFTPGS